MPTFTHLIKYILYCMIELVVVTLRLLKLFPDNQGDEPPVALLSGPEVYVFGDDPQTDYIWIGGPPE